MLASLLTDNLTVAFILGAVFCSVPVFLGAAGLITTANWQRLAEKLSVPEQFRDLATGVFTLGPLVYFVGFAAAVLYLNVLLLGRRRWRTGPKAPHMRSPRPAARRGAVRDRRGRHTAGGHHASASRRHRREDPSLSPETRALLAGLSARKPVFIQAYFSPEVPRSYVDARTNLVNMLREFEATGHGGVMPASSRP